MAKIIAIGGVPATGKTTMMRNIIKHHMPLTTFKYKLVRGMYNRKTNVYILGIYDNSLFSGTDKLSMAVQPDFISLIKKSRNATFVFEGDRLFNSSLFEQVKCDIFVLEADPEVVEKRHVDRQDNQSDKFKKAKQTKIQNIKDKYNVTILENNTEEQSKNNLNIILKAIKK